MARARIHSEPSVPRLNDGKKHVKFAHSVSYPEDVSSMQSHVQGQEYTLTAPTSMQHPQRGHAQAPQHSTFVPQTKFQHSASEDISSHVQGQEYTPTPVHLHQQRGHKYSAQAPYLHHQSIVAPQAMPFIQHQHPHLESFQRKSGVESHRYV